MPVSTPLSQVSNHSSISGFSCAAAPRQVGERPVEQLVPAGHGLRRRHRRGDRASRPRVLQPAEVERLAALEQVVLAADQIGRDPVVDDTSAARSTGLRCRQYAPSKADAPPVSVCAANVASNVPRSCEVRDQRGQQRQQDGGVLQPFDHRPDRVQPAGQGEVERVELHVDEPAHGGDVLVEVVARHDREDRLQRAVLRRRAGGEQLVDAEVGRAVQPDLAGRAAAAGTPTAPAPRRRGPVPGRTGRTAPSESPVPRTSATTLM